MSDSEELPPPPGPLGGAHAGKMRGSRHNLTEGPITRTLLLFSLPLLGGNILQSLNGTVNQFWVSHTLGVTAITALGNANTLMFLLHGRDHGHRPWPPTS